MRRRLRARQIQEHSGGITVKRQIHREREINLVDLAIGDRRPNRLYFFSVGRFVQHWLTAKTACIGILTIRNEPGIGFALCQPHCL